MLSKYFPGVKKILVIAFGSLAFGILFSKVCNIFKDILWKFNLIGSNVIFLFKAFFFFF